MSSLSGLRLEDFIRDCYSPRVPKKAMELFEPYRETIEHYLENFDEDECGSWRDYRNYVMADMIPEDVWDKATAIICKPRRRAEISV